MPFVYLTKTATERQLKTMSMNLSKKLRMSVSVEIQCWTHTFSPTTTEYRIALVPGFNEDCTSYTTKYWQKCIKTYRRLMKGEKIEE